MNRTLRRLFSFLIVLIFTFVAFNVNVTAASAVTDIGIARYYEEEVISSKELTFGVKHQTVKGYTSAKAGEVTTMGTGITESFVADKYYSQQVNVLEVPSDTHIKIVPWARLLQGEWTLSTVRAMAKDFEQKNPGKKVIAAINADFFDINSNKLFPKTPSGAHASMGENYKTLTGAAVGFTNDGTEESLIGNVALKRATKMTLSVYDENDNIVKEFSIDKINTTPAANEISIYYAKWALEAGWAKQRIKSVAVENAIIVKNGEYALPVTNVNVDGGGSTANDFYGKGVITKIGDDTLSTGDFAIVSNNTEVTEALKVGVKIRAQWNFTGEFENVENIVGVGQTILYNGEKQGDDTARHPRTMIGVREDGTIIMTVVDGRQQAKQFFGASQAEMAAILKHYGCVEGYNLDGGGSSTMLILNDDGDLEVMNSPSDGSERSDSNCILITIDVPDIDYEFTNVVSDSFTFSASVVDKNGFDFDDLYIKIGDDMKKVENGKATFSDLTPNTRYQYMLFGKKGDAYENLCILGSTYSAKRVPVVRSVEVVVDEDDYIFTLDIFDPDNAISRKSITVGDKSALIQKMQVTFEDFTGSLSNIVVDLSYDVNDGKGRIDISLDDTKLKMKYGLLVYAIVTSDKFNNKVMGIYRSNE